MAPNPLRSIPSVNELLESPAIKAVVDRIHPGAVMATVRSVLDEVAAEMRSAAVERTWPSVSELAERISRRVFDGDAPDVKPAINATGVLFHPELGCPPLADDAVKAMVVAAGEYTLGPGPGAERDSAGQSDCVERLLKNLTGAEAAFVAVSDAAATVLALAALAAGREVIVARAQMIRKGRPLPLARVGRGRRSCPPRGRSRQPPPARGLRPGDHGPLGRAGGGSSGERRDRGEHGRGDARRRRQPGPPSCVAGRSRPRTGRPVRLGAVWPGRGAGRLREHRRRRGPRPVRTRDVRRARLRNHRRPANVGGSNPPGGDGRGISTPTADAGRAGRHASTDRDPGEGTSDNPGPAIGHDFGREPQESGGAIGRPNRRRFHRRERRTRPGGRVPVPAPIIGAELPGWCVRIKPSGISVARLAEALRSGAPAVVGLAEQEHLVLNLRSVLPRQDTALVEAIGAVAAR